MGSWSWLSCPLLYFESGPASSTWPALTVVPNFVSAPFICQGYISALFAARPKGTDATHLSLLNPGSAEPVFFLHLGARVSPPHSTFIIKGKPFSRLALYGPCNPSG